MSPEEAQAQEKAQRAEAFVTSMLGAVKSRLFVGREKEWWQGQKLIKAAILEPSRWMNERAAALSAARYREIITQVISDVATANRKNPPRRMAYYFLDAMQTFMRVKGDTYYEEGKATPRLSIYLGQAVRGLAAASTGKNEAVDLTATLAAGAAVVRSKGGRPKKVAGPETAQGELFG